MLRKSILMLGPTGVGKSPLGDRLEKNGIKGKRCFHFDFGRELRDIARPGTPPEGFKEKDVSFIRDVLENGSLLEDEHFHIAEKIICRFLRSRGVQREDVLILNGLPRHTEQARDMSAIVEVMSLVVLECGAGEVRKRIRQNTGRDRTGRADDSIVMVRKKLDIFSARTAPLIEYYSDRGCSVLKIKTTALSTPENVYDAFIAAYAG